ncbi:MAG TPA: WYL domain-containing protein [Gemmatimonadaceae bacterium]|nr:WYL domain-containing protein [Gemmatimonadaceae bacterium]
MPSATKTQRWIDLIAALLSNRLPSSFERLAREVPAYMADGSVQAGKPSVSVKRTFERDKKELHAFGIPIERIGDDGDPDAAYSLRSNDFYLPYLSLNTSSGARATTSTKSTDRYGYRSLSRLAFEPDELAALASAGKRAQELGDPALAVEARSALRKLAFDLPIDPDDTNGVDTKLGSAGERIVLPRAVPSKEVLQSLGDALIRRKTVEFSYNSMNSGVVSERTVEPYGVFFLNGHWYLAARETDTDDDTVKNFRVSRISNVRVNTKRSESADYTIPASFKLRDHGQSRQAWELGDGETISAVVDFIGDSGATVAGTELGTSEDDDIRLRRFRVRRMDAFVRWLLSFAGEAIPVQPPELVNSFREQIAATLKLYQ